MEASFENDGALGIVRVAGEMRVDSLPRFEDALAAVRAAGATHLLLDLSKLAFMDSASAGTLLRVRQEQRDAQGRFVLFGLQRMVARLIDAAGLAPQFDIAADEEAARLAVAGF